MMLVGWPHILNYLRTGKTSGKAFPAVDAETVERLTAAKLPVKYVPELDDLPRITEGDILRWMQAREDQRRREILWIEARRRHKRLLEWIKAREEQWRAGAA